MSNPLTDPDLYPRLSKLMVRDMTRLALSTDALVNRMREVNKWHKGSASTLNRYISGTGEYKITPQTLGLISVALEWSDYYNNLVLLGRIELPTSSLPRMRSTI